MAKVKDELLDHDYDGIKEFDNDLPPWWLWLFYICIFFAVVYMVHYHVAYTGKLQDEEYQDQMAEAEVQKAAYREKYGTIAALFSTDAKVIAEGKSIYEVNCVACHGIDGGGTVGPNLTDKYWIHGNTAEQIVHVINKGVPEKGMIPWEKTLKQEQVIAVASYIKTLEGTTPATPKEPQGDLIP